MFGSGEFNFFESEKYEAVALPTLGGGSFIIALPTKGNELATVESEIAKSGTKLLAFVESLTNSTEKKQVDIRLPRLTIQITHEWSTPSNRVCILQS